MDRHLFDAFIESITDVLADKVVERLGLKPPVRTLPAPALPPSPTLPGDAPNPLAATTEYLTPKEMAALLGVSVSGLERMRAEGRRPKFIKIGGPIRYPRSDLT